MIKSYLKFFLLSLSIIVPASYANKLQLDSIAKVPVGSWGVNVDGEDQIGLTCKEYRDQVNCEMFWFFTDFRVSTKVEDGILKIYTGKDENDAILVSMKSGLPHKFLPDGILKSQYFTKYESLEFKGFKELYIGSYEALKNKAKILYHERGSLHKIPLTMPAWVMNPSVHLFKNEKDGAYIGKNRVLAHPNLSAKTLQEMYQLFSTNGDNYPSELVTIARNPSTSRDTLEKLFDISATVRVHTLIWNAASSNQNAPSSYKEQYHNRIKAGTKETQYDFLSDHLAPANLLDWVARNSKHGFFRSRIYSHPNVSAETLDYLFENRSTDEDKRRLTDHKNISDATLLKLANVDLKSKHDQNLIMELILRNKTKGKEAVKVALVRLANHKDVMQQSKAAKDDRLTRDLIKLLIDSKSVIVRRALAANKALTYDDLVVLSSDEYSNVSKLARMQLEKRFHKESLQFVLSLPPLSELNQAYNLNDELRHNVINDDIVAVKKTIQKLTSIGQSTNTDITPALKKGNKELVRLLASINTYNFKRLVNNKEFNTEWLVYFLDMEPLKSLSHAKALGICFHSKRLDYAKILIDNGYDINAPAKRIAENHLNIAIYSRSEEMLDFMLDNNINTEAINPRSKYSPLILARKMNFIYALEKLDINNIYTDDIAKFKKENTPNKNSLLIGDWSNLKGEFKTSILKFNSDGSGRMMGAVGGALMVWKEMDSSNLEITPSINGELNKSKIIKFNYELVENILTLWPVNKRSNKVVYFRQGVVPDLLALSDDSFPIDEKYIGIWFNEKKRITLTIKSDSTADINKKEKLELKKGKGNYVLAFRPKSKKTNKEKPLVLTLNKKKTVLTATQGRRSFEFKRNEKM